MDLNRVSQCCIAHPEDEAGGTFFKDMAFEALKMRAWIPDLGAGPAFGSLHQEVMKLAVLVVRQVPDSL